MHKNLVAAIREARPQVNTRALNGMVVHQMRGVEAHINNVWRLAEKGFPEGLRYVDGKRCTPLEQYKEITRPVKPTHRFEMTRSDLFMVKYSFTFNGVPIRPHYINLPFLKDSPLIYLKDTQYKILPVVGGKVFNIEDNKIYMPVLVAKMGFYKFNVSCIKGDTVTHATSVASYLFNMNKNERSKLEPSLVHYLLCQYGLTETLKLFGITGIYGGPELNFHTVDDKMVIYRSRQLPALLAGVRNQYVKNEIRICVPKVKVTKVVDSVIATIFYIIDQCTEAVSVEDLDIPELWASLLGRFIFAKPMPLQKMTDKITDHLVKLPLNLDPLAKRSLELENIHCKDLYELFQYLIVHFNDIVIHTDVGCMYNKEISIVKHLLFNIVYNIFMLMYKLRKLPPHLVTAKKIQDIMMVELKRDKILETSGHGELVPASIASNALPFSATSSMISHNKATTMGGGKNGKKSAKNSVGLKLHASQYEVGSVNWITSQDPSGRYTVNPFIRVSDRNVVIPKPHLAEAITSLSALLQTKGKTYG